VGDIPLKTVKVPDAMASVFGEAERVVASYFGAWQKAPERGAIEIFGERYVLVRAASLSVEFFALVEGLYGPGREDEAATFARNILFDLAHAIGKADARSFHAKMGLVDPIARLSAGPVHFSHTGWAFVDIHAESVAAPDDSYCLIFDHPYSFESDAWIRAGRASSFPVCIMNAGYSSGWCEESFGIELVASEVLCRARGDEHCRFVMATPSAIERHVRAYREGRPQLAGSLQGHQIPDFFARKRAEEELRRSHAELERRVEERTAELSRANELLQREMEERARVESALRQTHKLEALGRLAGGIAHDFNNLMGVVLGRCALLRGHLSADDPLCAEVEEIRAAGERAAALTQQLLAFGRAQVLRRVLLDFDRTVDDVLGVLRPLIPEDIEIRRVPSMSDRGVGSVEGDRGQIEQVVMNLVINARDAMPRGGVLTVETTRVVASRVDPAAALAPGDYACLSVTDTGVGMTRETMARVFEPFFTTKDEGASAGLGLATVYGIVKQSGGGITVASEPGRGSRFRVYLPRSDQAASAVEPRSVTPTPSQGTETILLVEDRQNLRTVLAQVLEGFGYRVLSASGADEALALADRHAGAIHLLLTDVVMPRMGGADLARRISERCPEIRVLYMSGHASDAVVRHGVLERTSGFLQKPFAPEQLAAKIREVLAEEV